METQPQHHTADNAHNGKTPANRYTLIIKGFLIGLLMLLLLIPTQFISSIINERNGRREAAIQEVGSKWALQQTFTGPILVVPASIRNNDILETTYLHFLPENLSINGMISPQMRHRGIFEIPVYTSKVDFSGKFAPVNAQGFSVNPDYIEWENARLCVGISDMRGIEEQINLKWNNQQLKFGPGVPSSIVIDHGIGCSLPIKVSDTSSYNFSFSVQLKGTERMNFVPVGKETQVTLAGEWKNPSFDGAFLPITPPVIQNNRFTANWKIQDLNRTFPQKWQGQTTPLESAAFGVNLFVVADHYQQSTRAIKYAIMVIGLTFLIFFFIELTKKSPVHLLQYFLIGLALVIFYTLQLSISEFLSFKFAYLIAAFMTITLIGWYANSVLNHRTLAIFVSGALVFLYGFIFIILQLEDFALLVGSVGLFVILAAIMYVSRSIDWSKL